MAANNIEKIMNLMEANYNATGDVAMKPSTGLYGEFVSSLARSRDQKKARMAAITLKKVIDEYKETGEASIRPNRFLYNAGKISRISLSP